jgi:hypothetical protein
MISQSTKEIQQPVNVSKMYSYICQMYPEFRKKLYLTCHRQFKDEIVSLGQVSDVSNICDIITIPKSVISENDPKKYRFIFPLELNVFFRYLLSIIRIVSMALLQFRVNFRVSKNVTTCNSLFERTLTPRILQIIGISTNTKYIRIHFFKVQYFCRQNTFFNNRQLLKQRQNTYKSCKITALRQNVSDITNNKLHKLPQLQGTTKVSRIKEYSCT